jgi:hypothetical protein
VAFKLSALNRSTFDRMLARAQALATGKLSKGVAPRAAAAEVRTLAGESKAAQKSPQGRPWPKTKDKAALKWPSQARVTVTVQNGKVVAVLTWPSYLVPQHGGWSRFAVARPKAGNGQRASGPGRISKRWRGKARRVLPKNTPPPPWKKKIVAALNQGWRSFMHSASVKRSR